MAREIVWTLSAIEDRLLIYNFWKEHNSSDLFSEKLDNLFIDAANLISEFPEIGRRTKKKALESK
jgi:hypothetical protein